MTTPKAYEDCQNKQNEDKDSDTFNRAISFYILVIDSSLSVHLRVQNAACVTCYPVKRKITSLPRLMWLPGAPQG